MSWEKSEGAKVKVKVLSTPHHVLSSPYRMSRTGLPITGTSLHVLALEVSRSGCGHLRPSCPTESLSIPSRETRSSHYLVTWQSRDVNMTYFLPKF